MGNGDRSQKPCQYDFSQCLNKYDGRVNAYINVVAMFSKDRTHCSHKYWGNGDFIPFLLRNNIYSTVSGHSQEGHKNWLNKYISK